MALTNNDRIIAWRDIWLDNSDPENIDRGIIGFSRYFFPRRIKEEYGISTVHKSIYSSFIQLYNPKYKYSVERQMELILPRDFAKSTISCFIIPLYIAAMNGCQIRLPDEEGQKVFGKIEESVVVVASKTSMFAESWITQQRDEIMSNKKFRMHFGNMRPDKVKDEYNMWQKAAYEVKKEKLSAPFTGMPVTFVGKGVGQQLRGLNHGGGRVTLILFDDLYGLDNTITEESRNKVRIWYNADAIGTIDGNYGKSITLGTIVHDDTILIDNKRNPYCKVIELAAMDINRFNEVIEKHCLVDRTRGICQIPNSGECEKLSEEGYTTNWEDRYPIEYYLLKFADAISKGRLAESMFWQEYFHKTLSEAEKQIKQSMFKRQPFEVVGPVEMNGQLVTFVHIGDEYYNVDTVVGVDSGSSERSTACDSSLVWVGMDYRRVIYVLRYAAGRWGIRDDIREGFRGLYTLRNQIVSDTSHIETEGTIDNIFRMIGTHVPRIAFETDGVGNPSYRELRRVKAEMHKSFMIVPVQQLRGLDKLTRIEETLAPHYQTLSVIHQPNMEQLEYQVEHLRAASKVDIVDAFATAVRQLRAPQRLEYRPRSVPTASEQITGEQLQALLSKMAKTHPVKVEQRFDRWRTR